MKAFFGILLIIVGACLGLYAGLWWAFIGGSVQIIEQIRGPELSAMTVAIGMAKIFCAAAIGGISAAVCIVPGVALLES